MVTNYTCKFIYTSSTGRRHKYNLLSFDVIIANVAKSISFAKPIGINEDFRIFIKVDESDEFSGVNFKLRQGKWIILEMAIA